MTHDYKLIKKLATSRLAVLVDTLNEMTDRIDVRLTSYLHDLHLSPDNHNVFEILAAVKFLRLLSDPSVFYDYERVHHTLRDYEGIWHRVDRPDGEPIYEHIEGGLQFSGLRGRTYYRLTPVQVFMLACSFGFEHYVDTQTPAGSRPLLPTEKEEYGRIYDLRNLVTEVVLFIPRKFCKTTMGAFFQFETFLFGDYNSEGYCVANSEAQAKILFHMTKDLIRQIDPKGKRIRMTATEITWKPNQLRESSVSVLSAGGKTKDGLFAQLCSADEFGAAEDTNGKCDMANLVNVIESSMGPRRNPLTVHTTTAGLSKNSPLQRKLEVIQQSLILEVADMLPDDYFRDFPKGNPMEYNFSFILCPDPWEQDPEYIFSHPHTWRKANPHIGITVQPDFYEREIEKSRQSPDKMNETLCKLFNVFASDKVSEWITPERVRGLQIPVTIDDIANSDTSDQWLVFDGMDFSLGNDLHALTHLLYNTKTGEFFADLDAWITEWSLHNSSVSNLYSKWVEDGWLHVSPGETLDANLPVNRIIHLAENLTFVGFGYDPYKAKEVINTLSSWVYTMGFSPKECIIPMRQNFASYNPCVLHLDTLVRSNPPGIRFSSSPLWPWQFGNVLLATSTDGMENHKPIKRSDSDGCKVDNVQCLCTAIHIFDIFDGKELITG